MYLKYTSCIMKTTCVATTTGVKLDSTEHVRYFKLFTTSNLLRAM